MTREKTNMPTLLEDMDSDSLSLLFDAITLSCLFRDRVGDVNWDRYRASDLLEEDIENVDIIIVPDEIDPINSAFAALLAGVFTVEIGRKYIIVPDSKISTENNDLQEQAVFRTLVATFPLLLDITDRNGKFFYVSYGNSDGYKSKLPVPKKLTICNTLSAIQDACYKFWRHQNLKAPFLERDRFPIQFLPSLLDLLSPGLGAKIVPLIPESLSITEEDVLLDCSIRFASGDPEGRDEKLVGEVESALSIWTHVLDTLPVCLFVSSNELLREYCAAGRVISQEEKSNLVSMRHIAQYAETCEADKGTKSTSMPEGIDLIRTDDVRFPLVELLEKAESYVSMFGKFRLFSRDTGIDAMIRLVLEDGVTVEDVIQ